MGFVDCRVSEGKELVVVVEEVEEAGTEKVDEAEAETISSEP